MGGAFIAVADDATAASWNPGGLVQLGRPEVSVVAGYTHRGEDTEFGGHPEASGQQQVDIANLNYFSVAVPFTLFDRNMIVSVNRQHLYDFKREWDFPLLVKGENFSAIRDMKLSQEGELSAIGFSYCIQMTPEISFGATLNAWKDWLGDNGWETARRDRWSGVDRTQNSFFTIDRYKWSRYSFSGFNANAGAFWNITEKVTLGAVIKTPFTADLKHEAYESWSHSSSSFEPPEGPSESSSNEKLDMPMSFGMGLAWRLSDRFTASIDIYRTEWSDFILTGEDGNEISPISGRSASRSDVEATHQVRIGAEYLIYDPTKPKLIFPLRGGLFYDPAPAEGSPDEYYGLSLGSGVAAGRFIFDAAYQFRFGKKVGGSLLESYDFSRDVTEHTLYSSIIVHF